MVKHMGPKEILLGQERGIWILGCAICCHEGENVIFIYLLILFIY